MPQTPNKWCYKNDVMLAKENGTYAVPTESGKLRRMEYSIVTASKFVNNIEQVLMNCLSFILMKIWRGKHCLELVSFISSHQSCKD